MWKYIQISSVIVLVAFHPVRLRADECDLFRFEKKESISLQDFGRLAESKVVSGPAGSVRYWMFDREDHPERKEWAIVGFLMFRTGDLGEVPIGGLLWARKPASLRSSVGEDPNGNISVTFELGEATRKCSSISFTLSPDGQVRSGSKLIGKIN